MDLLLKTADEAEAAGHDELLRTVGTNSWRSHVRNEGVRFFVYEADGVRRRNVLFRGGARLWRDV